MPKRCDKFWFLLANGGKIRVDIKDFKVGQNAFVRLTGNASRGKKAMN